MAEAQENREFSLILINNRMGAAVSGVPKGMTTTIRNCGMGCFVEMYEWKINASVAIKCILCNRIWNLFKWFSNVQKMETKLRSFQISRLNRMRNCLLEAVLGLKMLFQRFCTYFYLTYFFLYPIMTPNVGFIAKLFEILMTQQSNLQSDIFWKLQEYWVKIT